MRILHVTAGPAQARASLMLADGVLALSEAGLEQSVLAPRAHQAGLDAAAHAGVGLAFADFDPLWRAATRKILEQEIARFAPQVIQYWGGRAARFAPPRHKARSLLWHAGLTKPARLKACRWHGALTPKIAEHLLSQGLAGAHVVQWNPFVPVRTPKSCERAQWGIAENASVVLCLARLQAKEGVDILLRALGQLENVHAWLAGDGPQKDELAALAQKLGLEQRVHFLGPDADRAALLGCCDVLALPAREDHLGLAVLEAWAANRPVIAAQIGGAASLITPERDGLLVPSENPEALAQALRRALEDGDLAAKLVANGALRFAKGFTQTAFTRAALSLYERVDRAAQARAKASALAEP